MQGPQSELVECHRHRPHAPLPWRKVETVWRVESGGREGHSLSSSNADPKERTGPDRVPSRVFYSKEDELRCMGSNCICKQHVPGMCNRTPNPQSLVDQGAKDFFSLHALPHLPSKQEMQFSKLLGEH